MALSGGESKLCGKKRRQMINRSDASANSSPVLINHKRDGCGSDVCDRTESQSSKKEEDGVCVLLKLKKTHDNGASACKEVFKHKPIGKESWGRIQSAEGPASPAAHQVGQKQGRRASESAQSLFVFYYVFCRYFTVLYINGAAAGRPRQRRSDSSQSFL